MAGNNLAMIHASSTLPTRAEDYSGAKRSANMAGQHREGVMYATQLNIDIVALLRPA
ncbi:iron-dicitrate transporter substrate-binding subunit [Anopheles sinensis]|uniref:Iron-dicitrate transporter substrate-binding subunit n=1 Tax=Anopheles sinensis TaxID=74873 RepID=A0A084VRQ6_ANOSI|nr:iron-dicitrate transporter substrate-binding subunit [Anopheles sinensis]